VKSCGNAPPPRDAHPQNGFGPSRRAYSVRDTWHKTTEKPRDPSIATIAVAGEPLPCLPVELFTPHQLWLQLPFVGLIVPFYRGIIGKESDVRDVLMAVTRAMQTSWLWHSLFAALVVDGVLDHPGDFTFDTFVSIPTCNRRGATGLV
jgi:hypothetical protein